MMRNRASEIERNNQIRYPTAACAVSFLQVVTGILTWFYGRSVLLAMVGEGFSLK